MGLIIFISVLRSDRDERNHQNNPDNFGYGYNHDRGLFHTIQEEMSVRNRVILIVVLTVIVIAVVYFLHHA